jgi:hypothetical protein
MANDVPVTNQETKQPLPFIGNAAASGTIRAHERTAMQTATADIYAAHQRAIQYPRDEERCYKRIIALCENVHFAAKAMYRVPKGDIVEGLGIRAAEAFAVIWGNLRSGVVEHGQYDDQSQFEAYSYDLETNFHISSAFTVKHERQSGDRLVKLWKPDDIDNLCKIRQEKHRRNTLLKQIPSWIREEAIKTIKRTLHQNVGNVPDAWSKCKARFAQLGVSEDSLWRYLNKKKDPTKLDAADIVDLRILNQSFSEEPELLDQVFPERDKKATSSESSSAPSNDTGVKKPATQKPGSWKASKKSSDTTEGETSTSSTAQKQPTDSTQSGAPQPPTEPQSSTEVAPTATETITPKESTTTTSESAESDDPPCSETCPEECPNHEQMTLPEVPVEAPEDDEDVF